MNAEQFINIVNAQNILRKIYLQQKQERKLEKAKQMREKRQAHRLQNPLPHPYKKSYFTKNAFKSKNQYIN
jgi:hypothetical protein